MSETKQSPRLRSLPQPGAPHASNPHAQGPLAALAQKAVAGESLSAEEKDAASIFLSGVADVLLHHVDFRYKVFEAVRHIRLLAAPAAEAQVAAPQSAA